MRYSRCLVLCAALSLGAPSVSFADDAGHAKMLELSKKASEAFQAGEYEKAAKLFAEANKAEPNVILTMNEMIAWYQHGDCVNALETSTFFLKYSKDDVSDAQNQEDRRNARRVNFDCSIRLGKGAIEEGDLRDAQEFVDRAQQTYDGFASKDEFGAEDQTVLESLKGDLVAAKKAKEDAGKGDQDGGGKTIEDPGDTKPAEGGGLSGLGYVGVGLVGVGVVGLGAGVAILSSGSELANKCAVAGSCTQEEVDEVNGNIATQTIAYGVGAGALAIGATLLILDLTSEKGDSSGALVAPVVGPDSAGVMMKLRF